MTRPSLEEMLTNIPDDMDFELARIKGGWMATIWELVGKGEEHEHIPYSGTSPEPYIAILWAFVRYEKKIPTKPTAGDFDINPPIRHGDEP